MATSIELPSGRELKVLDEFSVSRNIAERGFLNDPAVANLERSDLTKHVYEGGFKVWECSIDLCNFIEMNAELFANKKVIELGCGAGLPGILSSFVGASLIALQDFNECVIDCFTKDNLVLNNASADKFAFVSGPWQKLEERLQGEKFDIVLTSETIYNEEDMPALHDAIDKALNADGFCWVAAKIFYFGVGGSVPSFTEYVKSRNVFSVKDAFSMDTNETGVPRQILELRRL